MKMVKRARCTNWEHQEKLIMRMVLRPYIHIIENKDTTTKTNNIKRRAWAEITEKFNKANFRARDKKQIINQWRITKTNLTNPRKKTFRNVGPHPSQETNEFKEILVKKIKIESNMDDYDGMKELSTQDGPQKDPFEFMNTSIGEMNPLSAELSSSTSQETLASNDHSPSASPSHIAAYPREPLSSSQPVPPPRRTVTPGVYQRPFRKRFEKNNISGRSHLDTHYIMTQENNRLEKEHQFRMETMAEFHKQAMKNLKLQQEIYEKILENYSKPMV